MLFERPNVRVHNDPLRMCPSRKSATGGRETPGRLFFGSFLWSEQRNEQTIFEIFWIQGYKITHLGPLLRGSGYL